MTNLEKLIESNATEIEALTDDLKRLERENKRDRDAMYGLMRDLTQKHIELVSHQARSYELIQNLSDRQNQLTNQQQQLIDILKRVTEENS